jgi:hypothetical protein
MSLFRILLILVVVVMLWPVGNDHAASRSDVPPQPGVSTGEFVDAAVSAAYDVFGICSRQPVVCTIGHELWTTFQRKSAYLAGHIYDWAMGADGARRTMPAQPGYVPQGPDGMSVRSGQPSARIPSDEPGNTLTEGDRALPWRGPAG